MKRRTLAPTPARRPSTRRVATAIAGVALAAVTAGCQVFSPVQTNATYVPADGVPADVGQLAVRDLVLVGDGNGTVVISGSAYNFGKEPTTVQIAPQAGADATAPPSGSEVQVGPFEQVNLSTKGLQLRDVKAKPGAVVPVVVTSSTGGTAVVKVPVLPATGYYATVTPAPTGS